MTYKKAIKALAAVAGLALFTSTMAATVTGSNKGLTWTAKSTIVGATSTATLPAGGDPRYLATDPKYSGVVSLIMEYQSGGASICTGSLLRDSRAILTAAHCVTPEPGDKLVRTTAYFYNGGQDSVTYADPASTAIEISRVAINPDYTGEVIDQNDIAVLTLSEAPPAFAQSYQLASLTDLQGQQFNVAGYGARSFTGGDVGADLNPGRLRQGDNVYDYRLGDARFGGFWDGFFGKAKTTDTWISDFDTGVLFPGNQSCIVALVLWEDTEDPTSACDFGVKNEVSVAGGDSGGPQFINGMLASITSFGLTFGMDFGDIDEGFAGDGAPNSSFGELNGFVPVYAHLAFIQAAIPEPSSIALFGIAGLGLLAARRRRA